MPITGGKFYSARIIDRRDISNELWTFHLDPGGEFPYRSGQYATLGVLAPEKHYERPYSIVSAPHEKYLEFFIELVPHGQLTPRLHQVGVGEELTLRMKGKGNFFLDLASGRPNHLLVSTVTGVAPYVSYVRSLYQQWKETPAVRTPKIFMLDGGSRSWELGYASELQCIAREVPWLTYMSTVSRPWEDKSWSGEVGRVDDLIRKYTDLWKLAPDDTKIYLCGHPDMIEHTRGIVRRRGWMESAIQAEAYFVPPRHDYSADADE